MIRKIIYIGIVVFAAFQISAQEYNIGVRAGQNYSTTRGAAEQGEELGFSGGFHFGINFSYNFTDNFALRTELLYMQNGYSQKYVGDSYYMIRLNDGGITFENGSLDMTLENSNAYLQIPISGHLRLTRKWEIFGGVYVGMLIGPTGRGRLSFESTDNPDDIFFNQSLDFAYYGDEAGEIITFGNTPAVVLVEGQDVVIPKVVGAYYQYLQKDGNLFNFLDAGVSAGFAYYFNRGFYLSIKGDFGLLDMTNNRMDRSLTMLNPDNTLFLRKDKDAHLGIQASFGFKF
ncbi:MAG: PorT family protein [Saprospiraceae bacterium]|nr:PorT family protein [Saprospiraceae bacterium]